MKVRFGLNDTINKTKYMSENELKTEYEKIKNGCHIEVDGEKKWVCGAYYFFLTYYKSKDGELPIYNEAVAQSMERHTENKNTQLSNNGDVYRNGKLIGNISSKRPN